jgi:tRNA A37 methylthiotransferase MiaB
MTGIDNRQSTIANQRACVVFLGCPKNQVDSEHVLGSLTEAGYTLTTEPRSADLIVITTCAFLQSAVRESEAAIEEALKHKQTSAGKKVVVAGCRALRQEPQAQIPRRRPLGPARRHASTRRVRSLKPQASSLKLRSICNLQSAI